MFIGLDIVDAFEFKRLLKKEWFLRYAYSKEELAASRKQGITRSTEFLTARFCAKEAVYKALIAANHKFKFHPSSISILKREDGYPYVVLHFPYDIKENFDLRVTISHKKNLCVSLATYTHF